MKASHTEYKQLVGMTFIDLKPGQFVFGRSKAASELNMKESTVWKYMKLLEKLDSISLKSNNKFSIVTVGKWGNYQSHDTDEEQQNNNKRTTKEQQNNTNKNLKNSSSSGSSQNDVIDFYHQNLQVGVTSSPYVYEQIHNWIEDLDSDLVIAAMKLSAKKEKKGFDYTEGILKKWVEAGVQTIDDARKFEQSFKSNGRKGTKKRPSKEDFDLSE
ncbi:DnaD domain-containing protein [Bacillus sp. KH172YL63]|uniref:DnaD domain-containing protein n=1 Tax=Bacillus sp. KH172YL63 TaxID=2709784 RepID=UPI0015639CA6|nr:DnaD domain protein [Bacillus sp. KH172YL63]